MIQRLTPPTMVGRVYSAADTLVTTPQTLSIALGAGLIGIAGYRSLLTAMALVITVTAGYLLSRAEFRRRDVTPAAADTTNSDGTDADPLCEATKPKAASS
jgi:hypothetical protein